jgi:hypothetical protein
MKSFIVYLATAFAVIISPIQALLLIMIAFILFDTSLGIYTAIKLEGIAGFKSTKLFNVVVKSFFYLTSIILAFMLDVHMFDSKLLGIPLLLCKAMTMVWIYIEVKSMDESSMKLGNKSMWTVLAEAVRRVKKIKKDLNEI